MKRFVARTIALLVVLLGVGATDSDAQEDLPDYIDFIFLIDVSGSMGLKWDGNFTGNVNETRLFYVKESLPALGVFINNIILAGDPGGSSTDPLRKRFAFATFPGDPSNPEVLWFESNAADETNLRNWQDGTEYTNILTLLPPPWNSTPIKSALNEAKVMFDNNPPTTPAPPSAEHAKIIILLTDGKQHGGDLNLDLLPADGITIAALKMGEDGSLETSDDLFDEFDFLLLHAHTGHFVLGDSGGTLLKDIIIFNLFPGLDWPVVVDPGIIVTSETSLTFDVDVNEYDRQLHFVATWHEPRDTSRMAFTLRAAGGDLITPDVAATLDDVDFSEGSTHLIYTVGRPYLDAHPGTWQLIIDGSPLPKGVRQKTDYIVGGPSGLKVTPQEARVNGSTLTGNTLAFSFQATAHDSVLANVDMHVDIERPQESPGNWFASNTLAPDEIRKLRSIVFPDHVSDAFRKYHYLRFTKNVPLPGSSTLTIQLFDDGVHNDGTDGDGIYGNSVKVDTAGFYISRLLASGITASGVPFTREYSQTHSVLPNIDGKWTSSSLAIQPVDGPAGDSRFKVTFTPRDRFGNYPVPGQADHISFDVSGGETLNGISDDLQGGYTQLVEVNHGATPTVVVSYKGTRFPPRELVPPVRKCGLALTPFVGYFFFDNKLGLDDAPSFGLRIGTCVSPRIKIGLEFAASPGGSTGGKDGVTLQANANLAYLFQKRGPVIPFAEAGGGWIGMRDFITEDDVGSVNYGAGLMVSPSNRYGLVISVKDHVAFDAFGVGTTHNIQVTLGLSLFLTK